MSSLKGVTPTRVIAWSMLLLMVAAIFLHVRTGVTRPRAAASDVRATADPVARADLPTPTSPLATVTNTPQPIKPSMKTSTSIPTATKKPKPTITASPLPTATDVPTRTPIHLPPAIGATETPAARREATATVTTVITLTTTPEVSLPPPTSTAILTSEVAAGDDLSYVPILMYHYVRSVNQEEDPLGYGLSVTPEMFDAHMAWLRDNHYIPIRMDTLTACLRGEQTCPEHSVAITFDDGYTDAATAVLPILERYGFPATFYIITDFVGQPNYMTWEQIKLLVGRGMEIGSHTINHPDLTVLSDEEAYDQISRSRTILEQQLGVPVTSFCYPIGSYHATTAALVAQAGYTNAVTTYPGSDMTLPYELPRRRIVGGETVEAFSWYVMAFDS